MEALVSTILRFGGQVMLGTERFGSDYTGDTTDVVTVGVNYWPIDNVVFKADYNDAGGAESINLGVGYSF